MSAAAAAALPLLLALLPPPAGEAGGEACLVCEEELGALLTVAVQALVKGEELVEGLLGFARAGDRCSRRQREIGMGALSVRRLRPLLAAQGAVQGAG